MSIIFRLNLHRFLFVYAVNYSSLKENQNLKKLVSAGHNSKKSEIGIGQENCNRCISSKHAQEIDITDNYACIFCSIYLILCEMAPYNI